MKTSARYILSATTALGLTAFTVVSAFTANGSPSVTATALGLLAIYGVVEMMILSYGPRRFVRPVASVPVLAMPSMPVVVSTTVAFPTDCSRRCAA